MSDVKRTMFESDGETPLTEVSLSEDLETVTVTISEPGRVDGRRAELNMNIDAAVELSNQLYGLLSVVLRLRAGKA